MQRIILQNNSPFGIIELDSPNPQAVDFSAVWAEESGENLFIVTIGNNDTLYSTSTGNNMRNIWSGFPSPILHAETVKALEAKRNIRGLYQFSDRF